MGSTFSANVAGGWGASGLGFESTTISFCSSGSDMIEEVGMCSSLQLQWDKREKEKKGRKRKKKKRKRKGKKKEGGKSAVYPFPFFSFLRGCVSFPLTSSSFLASLLPPSLLHDHPPHGSLLLSSFFFFIFLPHPPLLRFAREDQNSH